jgi:hypothetical protein
MITVAILINGHPLTARSAVNTMQAGQDHTTAYRLDDGSIIYHDRRDGAVALAKMMLDRINLDAAETRKGGRDA